MAPTDVEAVEGARFEKCDFFLLRLDFFLLRRKKDDSKVCVLHLNRQRIEHREERLEEKNSKKQAVLRDK